MLVDATIREERVDRPVEVWVVGEVTDDYPFVYPFCASLWGKNGVNVTNS